MTEAARPAAGKVTIRDVARAARVSRQTVTRAINNMPEISEDTRERVMRTVEELGYRPNRFAIDLSRQRTPAIGLIVRTFSNPYYAQLADAFVRELQGRGWQVLIGTADLGEHKIVEAMAAQVDAIIGYFEHTPSVRGLPIVQLEWRATTAGVHSVEFDLRAGIAEMISELRARGSRRFAMIDAVQPAGEEVSGSPRRRYFEDAVGEPCLVVTEHDSIAGGVRGLTALRGLDPGVDTVLAFNDLMAMGAMQGAHLLGVGVPNELRVVGIDGIALGEATSPTLTTLSMRFEDVAEAAASILATVFAERPPAESMNRVITPAVLWRESA